MQKIVCLIALLIVGGIAMMGCRAAQETQSRSQATPMQPSGGNSMNPGGQPAAELEPEEDKPAGAIKAHGKKDAPVRVTVYIPDRLGGSAVSTPYDMTLSMVAQIQKEFPGKVRFEVYALDKPEGKEHMKQDGVKGPTVVLTVLSPKAGEKPNRQVFTMVGERLFQPRPVADAIRQAMQQARS